MQESINTFLAATISGILFMRDETKRSLLKTLLDLGKNLISGNSLHAA